MYGYRLTLPNLSYIGNDLIYFGCLASQCRVHQHWLWKLPTSKRSRAAPNPVMPWTWYNLASTSAMHPNLLIHVCRPLINHFCVPWILSHILRALLRGSVGMDWRLFGAYTNGDTQTNCPIWEIRPTGQLGSWDWRLMWQMVSNGGEIQTKGP